MPSIPSQVLPHNTADGGGCLYLHRICGMGVGTQGEARIGVTQHPRHRADVHAALQRYGREGVPQIVEADMFQAQRFENFRVDGVYRVGIVHSACHW